MFYLSKNTISIVMFCVSCLFFRKSNFTNFLRFSFKSSRFFKKFHLNLMIGSLPNFSDHILFSLPLLFISCFGKYLTSRTILSVFGKLITNVQLDKFETAHFRTKCTRTFKSISSVSSS